MKKANLTKKHFADIIVIVSLLFISLLSVAALLILRTEGSVAVVEIDGVEVARYSLSEDGEYPLNGGTNLLIIKNGQAYMTEADCPDRTCVKTGRISYKGQSIVCLPNKISVRISGGADGVELVS